MKRLFSRDHVDLLALSPELSSSIQNPPQYLLREPLKEVIKKYWKNGSVLIFIGSVGAGVRIINPFIKDKDNDPAVIVMDFRGQNIVPVLGCHKAGAEKLAITLSEDFGAKEAPVPIKKAENPIKPFFRVENNCLLDINRISQKY